MKPPCFLRWEISVISSITRPPRPWTCWTCWPPRPRNGATAAERIRRDDGFGDQKEQRMIEFDNWTDLAKILDVWLLLLLLFIVFFLIGCFRWFGFITSLALMVDRSAVEFRMNKHLFKRGWGWHSRVSVVDVQESHIKVVGYNCCLSLTIYLRTPKSTGRCTCHGFIWQHK